jgi:nitrogen fixation NifU-like protein
VLESIFRELLLDHYRRPRNKGPMADATVSVSMRNPMCGDEIELHLDLADDRVRTVRFTGQGCSISQASASMMTEVLQGKSIDEALQLERRFLDLMHGEESARTDARLGDLRAMEGVARLPVRIKCALLAWNALDEAISAHRKGGGVMGRKLEFEEMTDLPAGFDPDEARKEI